jgi:hypothetical protein
MKSTDARADQLLSVLVPGRMIIGTNPESPRGWPLAASTGSTARHLPGCTALVQRRRLGGAITLSGTAGSGFKGA